MQLLHPGIAVEFTHSLRFATNDPPRRQEQVATNVAIAHPKAGIAPANRAASQSLLGILSSVDDAQQEPLRHVASFVIQKQALTFRACAMEMAARTSSSSPLSVATLRMSEHSNFIFPAGSGGYNFTMNSRVASASDAARLPAFVLSGNVRRAAVPTIA
jgi:hypothetical protein